MPPSPREAYVALLTRMREIALLRSCGGLLGWDEETYMPPAGTPFRAEQRALIAGLTHERFTDPAVGDLLAEVESSDLVADPSGDAAVNVRELRRRWDRQVKVPKRLVEEIARTCTQARDAWQEARAKSHFPTFRPWLEKVVALRREQAQHLVSPSPEPSPPAGGRGQGEGGAVPLGSRDLPGLYNALIDEYEPGQTAASLQAILQPLGRELGSLVRAIVNSGRSPDRDILARQYPLEQQRRFSREAAEKIGFDLHAGRIDETVHPFCCMIGPGDTRLTTRYDLHSFSDAFMGVLHEAGHGIYDQGLPAEHFGTPRGWPVSYGIHESQSRLWENFVGRSRPFWEHFFPRARQLFPEALGGASLDALYFALNDVRPSYIRVEADEATYNLHILLRFELEQRLIAGDLAPADVPGAWNERFEYHLGLRVPNDAEGCLQDIHWSHASFGYFPSYSLGNLYAAQFFEQANKDIGDLDRRMARGEFAPLREWLREKIHRHGQRWRAAELVEAVTGRPPSHEPLMRHLKGKYGPLYGIS